MGECFGKGLPSATRIRVWGGDCAPSQKEFLIFPVKWNVFVHFQWFISGTFVFQTVKSRRKL